MEPVLALVAILALFALLTFAVARSEGLAFLAPRSTRGIRHSALSFCSDRCRENGLCPLTRTAEAAADCPLWKYVDVDVPTALYGSPFEVARRG